MRLSDHQIILGIVTLLDALLCDVGADGRICNLCTHHGPQIVDALAMTSTQITLERADSILICCDGATPKLGASIKHELCTAL